MNTESGSINNGEASSLSKRIEITDQAFIKLADWLAGERGLDIRSYKDKCIRRRLGVRVKACGFSDLKEYIAYLHANNAEVEKLLETITINVSSFFRNPGMFDYLAAVIIPDLINTRRERGENIMNFWSAGCAGGEEPYSLAILIKEKFKNLNMKVKILATDIDNESLARADKGIYSDESLKLTSEEVKSRYFNNIRGRIYISDSIKNMVQFVRQDLLEDASLTDIDLILCRNVLMYFYRQQQKKILDIFRNALREAGYLILGRTEVLIGEIRAGFKNLVPEERIYCKEEYFPGIQVRGGSR